MPHAPHRRAHHRSAVATSALITFALAIQLATTLITTPEQTLAVVLLAVGFSAGAGLCAFDVWQWRTCPLAEPDEPVEPVVEPVDPADPDRP